jgi:ABC-type uncharacterized transport system involved in gliding motility auxiliary subunit
MKRLSDWLGYIGLVVLAAAVAIYFAPQLVPLQWRDARLWVAAAGAVLVVASLIVRIDFSRRVTRYGLNAIVMILLLIGVITFVEAVSARHNKRFDLTANNRLSLSPQTIQLLQNLKSDVAATAFFRSDQPGKKVAEDLLKQYAARSNGRFTWKMADPDREPALARRYGVESYGTVVLETKSKSEKVLDVEEEKVTNGLVKVTREGKLKIYVTRGHGELEVGNTDRQGFSEAKAAMERANFEVAELVLAREAKVPDDAALLIVPGPRTDLLPTEIDALDAYLGRGGKLLVMVPSALDPQAAKSQSLKKFLGKHGLTVHDDLVIELNPIGRIFGYGPEVPIVLQYDQHPITRDMGSLMTVFPLTRSIAVATPAPSGTTTQSLAKTSGQSWGETDLGAVQRGEAKPDAQDPKGPLSVAVVATVNKSRIVVFGAPGVAANQFLASQSVGNRDFFLNTVSWLAEQEDLIAIRPKDTRQTPAVLNSQQAQAVFLLPVVVLPGLALIAGISAFVRRRSSR